MNICGIKIKRRKAGERMKSGEMKSRFEDKSEYSFNKNYSNDNNSIDFDLKYFQERLHIEVDYWGKDAEELCECTNRIIRELLTNEEHSNFKENVDTFEKEMISSEYSVNVKFDEKLVQDLGDRLDSLYKSKS